MRISSWRKHYLFWETHNTKRGKKSIHWCQLMNLQTITMQRWVIRWKWWYFCFCLEFSWWRLTSLVTEKQQKSINGEKSIQSIDWWYKLITNSEMNQKASYSSSSDSMMPTLERNIELFFICFWLSYFFYSIFLYASTDIGPKVFLFSCKFLSGSIFRKFVVDFIDSIDEFEIMLIFMLSVGLLFYLLLKTWLLLVFRVTLNFFFLAKFKLTFMKFLLLSGS